MRPKWAPGGLENASWRILGGQIDFERFLADVGSHFWAMLEPCWSPKPSKMKVRKHRKSHVNFDRHFDRSGGRFWGHFWTILGPFWALGLRAAGCCVFVPCWP